MLEIKDLCLHYKQSQILFDINLTAAQGKVTCVMGTNGVGKTSLLRAISGTHHRTSGDYRLDGQEVRKPPQYQIAAAGVGYVPQGRMIFPLLSVRENLETGFACLPKSQRSVPDEIYELFPVLKDMMGRRGGDLSGGQQQQLAIGRALITRPKLLLLDEPTEGIQPSIVDEIIEILQNLKNKRGLTVVLVEQNLEFISALSERVYVIRRGVFSGELSPSQLVDPEIVQEFVGMN